MLRFNIVLCQFFPDFSGLDADHGITSRVVAYRTPEHLSANHPLAQAIEFTVERMSDDQAKKILGAPAARECVAGKYLVEVMVHQIDMFRAEYFRLPRWIGCQHIALRFPLTHNYTIAPIPAP